MAQELPSGKGLAMSNQSSKTNLFKIHIVGALVCLLIAGASVFFAGSAVSQRRGVFLNARHELANTKSLLSESASERALLVADVQTLELETKDRVQLVSVRLLNARTGTIVRLAESVGISIESLQPEDRITDKRVPVQPMRFIGSANADDLFLFLGLMSEDMPDIHIQSIDLISDSMESSNVEIDLLMYWFIDPADADA